METLIKTKDELKEHVSTAFNFSFKNIEPYVKRAEREYIKPIIGEKLYKDWAITIPTSEKPKEVFKLLCEASANIATYLYIPVGSVNIADNGILTISNQNTKPAEWWQVRDLQRSLVNLGFSAIDEALKIMEANESSFTDWIDTEGYTIFKELLTPKTQDFQRHFNISNSRRTFIGLRPYVLETQHQIFNWLDKNTFNQVKAASNDIEKQALDYAQAAQVNFAVVKAAKSGVFHLSPTGMFLRTLELPGEKTKEISSEQIQTFVQSRTNAAEEYLKLLKKHLEENPLTFSDYKSSEKIVEIFVHNTKSIVAF